MLVIFVEPHLTGSGVVSAPLSPQHSQWFEIVGLLAVMWLWMSVYIALVTALPIPVLIALARYFRWRRGVADVIAGGIPGYIAIVGFIASGPSAFGLQSIEAARVVIFLLIPGLLGGLCYWHLAGKPKPPYGAQKAAR